MASASDRAAIRYSEIASTSSSGRFTIARSAFRIKTRFCRRSEGSASQAPAGNATTQLFKLARQPLLIALDPGFTLLGCFHCKALS